MAHPLLKPYWRKPRIVIPPQETAVVAVAETFADPDRLRRNRAYQAFGAARQLWSCRDEEVLMDGPAGTGKTRGILEKIHFLAMKYPGSRHLICRKTRESMTESVLVTYEEKVLPEDSYLLDGPQRNLRQRYTYDNGSVIVVGGMDKPTKIMSTEYDTISLFEGTEFTEEDIEMLSTRLRNGRMLQPDGTAYHQMLVDCNPGNPNHWLNRRASSGLMTRLLSRHEDNPVLFDHKLHKWTVQGRAYLARLDKLSGHRRLRLRFGKWVAAEGLVYNEWDPLVHHITKFVIPPNWRRYRVIDFGYTNPFVCQWWALDDDDRAYMYREIYWTRQLVSDMAELIKKVSGDEQYEATISDHDSESRATLHDCGIFTIPAWKPKNSIQPGIEAVQKRLLLQEDHEGRKRPKLVIMKDCRCHPADEHLLEDKLPASTAEEFDGYMYPKPKEGSARATDKAPKEDPIKKDDHGMDAMRYFVSEVDNVAGMSLVPTAEESSVVK